MDLGELHSHNGHCRFDVEAEVVDKAGGHDPPGHAGIAGERSIPNDIDLRGSKVCGTVAVEFHQPGLTGVPLPK